MYYYRKVVPFALRPVLSGRTEYKFSLGTKDPREAKLKYPAEAAKVDALLAQAAGGPVHLNHEQTVALAGLWYTRTLDDNRAEPGDPDHHALMLDELQRLSEDGRPSLRRQRVAKAVASDIDELLAAEQLLIDDLSRAELEELIFWHKVNFYQMQRRRAGGDYSPDPKLAEIPAWSPPVAAGQPQKLGNSDPYTMTALIDKWAAEKNPVAKTRYSWPRIMKKLTDHIGHDGVTRITEMDIISWKDKLVTSGLAPETIGNHLIVARALFGYAKENKSIPTNPAADVRYKVKKAPGTSKVSYSEDDARTILLAARNQRQPHKRWVPWIAAFTGARVDEIMGAMVIHIIRDEGIDCLRVTPENREAGGSIKNKGSERTVPLHPDLIAEGFLDYAASLPKDGPLFPLVTPDSFGKRSGNGLKTIGRWIRVNLGITDPRKQPNHSWRHRFVRECRMHGIPRDARFAITGHVSGADGDDYGRDGSGSDEDKLFTMPILAAELAKLPSPVSPP